MNNPGLIRSLTGAYVLDATIDQDVQGWPIRRLGKLWGVYLDDTTPDLLSVWLPKAIAKYGNQGLKVLVGVASGEPHQHYSSYPCVIAAYERYIYGMGDEASGVLPPSAWGPVPKGFKAIICQWRFTGTMSNTPPTKRQRLKLLASVLARHPRLVFLY